MFIYELRLVFDSLVFACEYPLVPDPLVEETILPVIYFVIFTTGWRQVFQRELHGLGTHVKKQLAVGVWLTSDCLNHHDSFVSSILTVSGSSLILPALTLFRVLLRNFVECPSIWVSLLFSHSPPNMELQNKYAKIIIFSAMTQCLKENMPSSFWPSQWGIIVTQETLMSAWKFLLRCFIACHFGGSFWWEDSPP